MKKSAIPNEEHVREIPGLIEHGTTPDKAGVSVLLLMGCTPMIWPLFWMQKELQPELGTIVANL